MADNTETNFKDEEYTKEEKHLCLQAKNDFQDKQFESCLSALKQLMVSKSKDPTVLGNKAVAEYLKSNLTRSDDFKQQVQQIVGGQLDQASVNPRHLVLLLNYSVILFYQRQYHTADRLLEKLTSFIGILGEAMARRLIMLHIDVLLKLQMPMKVILRKCELLLRSSPDFSKEDTKEGAKVASTFPANISSEMGKEEVIVYKVKAFLMEKQVHEAKEALKLLSTSTFGAHICLFLKANVAYHLGNCRKALHILQAVSTPPGRSPLDSGDAWSVLQANNTGCIHMAMGKHNMGILYLQRALRENDRVSDEILLNSQPSGKSGRSIEKGSGNSGSRSSPGSELGLRGYSVSRHYEILHNLGVQLLFAGKPTAAFDYLLEVVNVYPRNPRLWLRLAECCIKTYRPNNDVDSQFGARMRCVNRVVGSGQFRKIVLGNGVGEVKKPWEESAAMPSPTLEFASLCIRNALLLLPWDIAHIEAACDKEMLGNEERFLLLNNNIIKWAQEKIIPVQPGGFIQGLDLIHLRSSILAAGAYIALCLDNPVDTIELSQALLRNPLISGAHRYLGRMYLAEALVQSNRVGEAAQLLNPEKINNVQLGVRSLTPPGAPSQKSTGWARVTGGSGGTSIEEQQDSFSTDVTLPLITWQPATLIKARSIMMYNQAAVMALIGNLPASRQLLQDCLPGLASKEIPLPSHLFFTRIYLDLMQGRRDQVLQLLRDNLGHLTVDGDSCLTGGGRGMTSKGQQCVYNSVLEANKAMAAIQASGSGGHAT